MSLKEKIIKKIKATAHKAYRQAAPVVKSEIQKTVQKGKEDVFCYILDGAHIFIMSAVLLSMVIKPSDLVRISPEKDDRKIYMVYNEVHVTNNYFKGGKLDGNEK